MLIVSARGTDLWYANPKYRIYNKNKKPKGNIPHKVRSSILSIKPISSKILRKLRNLSKAKYKIKSYIKTSSTGS